MRDLRKPVQKRAIRNARIRALKYCFLTFVISIFFTVPLFAVVHGLV